MVEGLRFDDDCRTSMCCAGLQVATVRDRRRAPSYGRSRRGLYLRSGILAIIACSSVDTLAVGSRVGWTKSTASLHIKYWIARCFQPVS
jgi:hypothetical protein